MTSRPAPPQFLATLDAPAGFPRTHSALLRFRICDLLRSRAHVGARILLCPTCRRRTLAISGNETLRSPTCRNGTAGILVRVRGLRRRLPPLAFLSPRGDGFGPSTLGAPH